MCVWGGGGGGGVLVIVGYCTGGGEQANFPLNGCDRG